METNFILSKYAVVFGLFNGALVLAIMAIIAYRAWGNQPAQLQALSATSPCAWETVSRLPLDEVITWHALRSAEVRCATMIVRSAQMQIKHLGSNPPG